MLRMKLIVQVDLVKKFYHINCGVKEGFPALRKAIRTRYEIFSPVLI